MNALRLLAGLAALSLVGCGTVEIGIEHPIADSTRLPAPTASEAAVPATATPPPTMLEESSPTQTQADSSSGEQMVKIFLVAVGDQGQSGKEIGCGDSVVPVQVPIPTTQGVLKAALVALRKMKKRDVKKLLALKVEESGKSKPEKKPRKGPRPKKMALKRRRDYAWMSNFNVGMIKNIQ